MDKDWKLEAEFQQALYTQCAAELHQAKAEWMEEKKRALEAMADCKNLKARVKALMQDTPPLEAYQGLKAERDTLKARVSLLESTSQEDGGQLLAATQRAERAEAQIAELKKQRHYYMNLCVEIETERDQAREDLATWKRKA